MRKIFITQRIDKVGKYNELRDNISQNFLKMMEKLKYAPIIIPNNLNIAKNIITTTSIDGIILTGGGNAKKNDVRSKVEFFLINYSIKLKKPLLGFCRGAQSINLFFDGDIERIKNHVRKKHLLSSKIFNKNFKTKCYHDYGITKKTVSKKLNILAMTNDKSIELFKHCKYKIYGMMWHPERSSRINNIELDFIKRIFK